MKINEFTLTFAPEVVGHFEWIDSKYHGWLLRTIRDRLTVSPAAMARNRKPLRKPAPFDATWELRCGPQNRFRVFYDVDYDSMCVRVLAIGIKDRNRLFIEGEEFAQ